MSPEEIQNFSPDHFQLIVSELHKDTDVQALKWYETWWSANDDNPQVHFTTEINDSGQAADDFYGSNRLHLYDSAIVRARYPKPKDDPEKRPETTELVPRSEEERTALHGLYEKVKLVAEHRFSYDDIKSASPLALGSLMKDKESIWPEIVQNYVYNREEANNLGPRAATTLADVQRATDANILTWERSILGNDFFIAIAPVLSPPTAYVLDKTGMKKQVTLPVDVHGEYRPYTYDVPFPYAHKALMHVLALKVPKDLQPTPIFPPDSDFRFRAAETYVASTDPQSDRYDPDTLDFLDKLLATQKPSQQS